MRMRLLMIFSAVLILSGCKKDSNCEKTTAAIAGSYKITAAKYKANASTPEVDWLILGSTPACQKDDITTLNANGTYSTTDAGVVCDPVNTDSGNWSVSGNAITIDGQTSNIESFNCSALVISSTGNFTSDDKLTITLTKQ